MDIKRKGNYNTNSKVESTVIFFLLLLVNCELNFTSLSVDDTVLNCEQSGNLTHN